MVRLSIGDNGIGMSKIAVSNLFQPFTQAESSTTRKFGGTGLGLSICKNLTDIMNGRINVESTQGKGSIFSVEIPFQAAGKDPDIDDSHDLLGLRILLADADTDDRRFAAIYLAHWNAVAEICDEPSQVLTTIETSRTEGRPFDIIVFGPTWGEEAYDRLREPLRAQAKSPSFVILTNDRTASKGMIPPDKVVIESDPLRRSSFIRGIAMAAGRASPDVEYEDEPMHDQPAPTIEEATATGRLILVVEDNVTNQDVIRRQLNRLGYACEVASDGVEGLAAWKANKYAVLLTDCHMPNMDGYELTASIREAEKGSAHRIPIIAITANALQGEGETCLEAGMDDYLSKPLEMDRLKATLKNWMPPDAPLKPSGKSSGTDGKIADGKQRPSGEQTPKAAGESAEIRSPIDPRALMDIFGDDYATFKEILGEFVQPSADVVAEIKSAYQSRDAAAIGAAGHKLKSSSRSVGAHALADLCANLEEAGKSGDWDTIEASMPSVEPALREVMDYIEAL